MCLSPFVMSLMKMTGYSCKVNNSVMKIDLLFLIRRYILKEEFAFTENKFVP